MSDELDIVWVVEYQNRHGIDVDVFRTRPDITKFLNKKDKPTYPLIEDTEWTDSETGWDAYIEGDEPKGWWFTYGNDEYTVRCWECRLND